MPTHAPLSALIPALKDQFGLGSQVRLSLEGTPTDDWGPFVAVTYNEFGMTARFDADEIWIVLAVLDGRLTQHAMSTLAGEFRTRRRKPEGHTRPPQAEGRAVSAPEPVRVGPPPGGFGPAQRLGNQERRRMIQLVLTFLFEQIENAAEWAGDQSDFVGNYGLDLWPNLMETRFFLTDALVSWKLAFVLKGDMEVDPWPAVEGNLGSGSEVWRKLRHIRQLLGRMAASMEGVLDAVAKAVPVRDDDEEREELRAIRAECMSDG